MGVELTLKAVSLGGYVKLGFGMRENVSQRIGECGICQMIKYQREPGFHHLYRLTPLTSLSVDTLGPLKQDENRNSLIIFIVCNISKLCGLYPTKYTTSTEHIRAVIQWASNFGVTIEIRTDGGCQDGS